eukprot:TRINITY_DN4366_c0_g2_i3.p1 TRINITY_DN4366_c0_g2~~TRINITY_DN4366_c0_g2_i3.p1  ORF type:complete len:462 (-),score=222.21 TRINITY_DN4366_c0_g2_i3:181-1566(-)
MFLANTDLALIKIEKEPDIKTDKKKALRSDVDINHVPFFKLFQEADWSEYDQIMKLVSKAREELNNVQIPSARKNKKNKKDKKKKKKKRSKKNRDDDEDREDNEENQDEDEEEDEDDEDDEAEEDDRPEEEIDEDQDLEDEQEEQEADEEYEAEKRREIEDEINAEEERLEEIFEKAQDQDIVMRLMGNFTYQKQTKGFKEEKADWVFYFDEKLRKLFYTELKTSLILRRKKYVVTKNQQVQGNEKNPNEGSTFAMVDDGGSGMFTGGPLGQAMTVLKKEDYIRLAIKPGEENLLKKRKSEHPLIESLFGENVRKMEEDLMNKKNSQKLKRKKAEEERRLRRQMENEAEEEEGAREMEGEGEKRRIKEEEENDGPRRDVNPKKEDGAGEEDEEEDYIPKRREVKKEKKDSDEENSFFGSEGGEEKEQIKGDMDEEREHEQTKVKAEKSDSDESIFSDDDDG